MWPFKKQSDTPEIIKKETTNDDPKPDVSTQFIFNPDATKKMIEDREQKTFNASRMRKKVSFEFSGDFLEIISLDFYGEFQQSENNQHILAWTESHSENQKTGRYILIENDELILRGGLHRPNDGKVANNGTFILSDWFSKEEFGGTFFAFGVDGKILIQKNLKANLGNNGLSDDGNYAVCQTWYSKISPEDSNKLFFFDLIKQELKWSCKPEPGNADLFRFDTENGILFLDYNDEKSYRYNFDGSFLDSDKLEKDKLEKLLEKKKDNKYSSNGYELFDYAQDKRKQLDDSNSELNSYDEIITLMKKALEIGVSEYTQSLVHRAIGEIYLKQNKTDETIHHFEMALSLNPKIGLKKVLQNLKNTAK